jgi:hypothetical protein
MPNAELHPISLDRAKHRLAHDIKTDPTDTFRELHSKVLAEVEILAKDLAALDVSMKELEAGYAKQDSEYQSRRAKEVKLYGANSPLVSALDSSHKANLALRLPARETALAISDQLDRAFKNYLDGGFSPAELKAAAEAGIGVLSSTGPLTIAVEIFKGIDRAIDRLDAEKRQAQQYALKLEILKKVIAGFATLFRTLRERVEQRLEDF